MKWRISKPTVRPNVLLFFFFSFSSPSRKLSSLHFKVCDVRWTPSEHHSSTSLNPFKSVFLVFWLDEMGILEKA